VGQLIDETGQRKLHEAKRGGEKLWVKKPAKESGGQYAEYSARRPGLGADEKN